MGGLRISNDEKSVSASIRKISYSDSFKSLIMTYMGNELSKSYALKSVNDLNMAFFYVNEIYDGVVIGPRSINQIESIFKTWNNSLIKI